MRLRIQNIEYSTRILRLFHFFSLLLRQGVKRIHAVSTSIIYSDLIEDIRLGSSFPFRSEKSTTREVTRPYAQTTTEGHLHAGARKALNLTPTPWQGSNPKRGTLSPEGDG